MHALNLKPEERYVSMRTFEQDIEKAAADEKKALNQSAQPVMNPIPQWQIPVPPMAYPPYPQAPVQQMPIQSGPYTGGQMPQQPTGVPAKKSDPGLLRWMWKKLRKKIRKAFK